MEQSTAVSIGELAKKFDITPRSIRFYEEQGLLNPGRVGQNRSYQKKDQVRLRLILRGKRLGFLLAEIKVLFKLYDSHSNSAAQLETMLSMTKEKRVLMQQQLHDVNMVLQELDEVEQRCIDELAELTNPPKLQRES